MLIQINNYNQSPANYTIDEYIPLKITINYSNPCSENIFYQQYKNKSNLIQLTIGLEYKELRDITIVLMSEAILNESSFNPKNYVSKPMASYLCLDEKIQKIKPFECLQDYKNYTVEIFQDAIKINLSNAAENNLLFLQSENFGIITNKYLEIGGFIVFNLSLENRDAILRYIKLENVHTL